MEKKAVIAVQFHWIFIIIAGGLILLFFGNLVFKHKDVADVQISATVLTDFDAILTGALVSTGTINVVDIPKFDMSFECDKYSIGNLRKQTLDRVIFAPDLIKGGTLIAYASDWSHPYRSSNFLYLTTPQVRYIIVDDKDDVGEYLNSTLPEEINKELIKILPDPTPPSSDPIENLNDYRVKYVFFNDPNVYPIQTLSKFANMPNQHITAIFIEPSLEAQQYLGHVTFFQKNGPLWEEIIGTREGYYTKEGLMAAVYSADHEMYKCGMDKAFDKLNIVTKIIKDRTQKLADNYLQGSNCHDIYTSSGAMLNTIISNSNEFTYTNANQIMQQAGYQNLQTQNQRAQLYSCPLIY